MYCLQNKAERSGAAFKAFLSVETQIPFLSLSILPASGSNGPVRAHGSLVPERPA